jgi:hypothetical protein
LRHAMALAGAAIAQYAVVANGTHWSVEIEPSTGTSFEDACRDAATALRELCANHRARAPALDFGRWSAPKPGEKRRRITVRRAPRDAACAS